MDLKFVNVINRFYPKGKFWEIQNNLASLTNGMSVEFSRIYDKSKKFYNDFNILNSAELAKEHSLDYLIIQDKFTNPELQRIIVEYLNKDKEFLASILDFATFINVTIEILDPVPGFKFGSSKFGDKFGTRGVEQNMQIFLKFAYGTTCNKYAKIVWLVNYLKPPYLDVIYSANPLESDEKFTFGVSQFGDKFENIVPCELF